MQHKIYLQCGHVSIHVLDDVMDIILSITRNDVNDINRSWTRV
jgi:hypothetical protein